MTTDTPRTDAAQLWHFDEPVVPKDFAKQIERELAHSLANQVKAQAEVEMFRKDNAALTYIGTNLESHNWNLKRELESTGEVLQQMTEDAVNLKAEVERLKEQLESTKQIAVKFWNVLEENGFKIELPK